jgi:hypothetical protein
VARFAHATDNHSYHDCCSGDIVGLLRIRSRCSHYHTRLRPACFPTTLCHRVLELHHLRCRGWKLADSALSGGPNLSLPNGLSPVGDLMSRQASTTKKRKLGRSTSKRAFCCFFVNLLECLRMVGDYQPEVSQHKETAILKSTNRYAAPVTHPST